jgi:hypothetical protein
MGSRLSLMPSKSGASQSGGALRGRPKPSGASSLGLHALELPAFAGALTSVDRGAHDT